MELVWQTFLDLPERVNQLLLPQRCREVAARPLKHGTECISRPTDPTRDGIRIVDRHQQAIDLIHRVEQVFSIAAITFTQTIKEVSAQLTRRFSQAIKIRCGFDTDLRSIRQWSSLNQGQGQACFGVLLKGVLRIPGMEDGRIWP